MVGGVPAYSTLGKFNDPILNTMMTYGDDELASIMFHELSHQLVYIPDDTSFNEAFAVAVEHEGLARWLKFRGREADLDKYLKRRGRQAEGMHSWRVIATQLDALYQHAARCGSDARAQGGSIRARWCASCRRSMSAYGTQSGLAAALDGKPNNARLASLATYYDCVPGFERLLARRTTTICRASMPRCANSPNYRAMQRRAQLCVSDPAERALDAPYVSVN